MRANLDQAVRRRILADLGIDVWRLRTAEPARPAVADSRAVEAEPDAAARSAPSGDGGRAGPRQFVEPAVEPAVETIARPRSGGAVVQPFSVLSLSTEGVTLLLERSPSGRESRLVRDLLAAATGRWDLEPALRQFDWPPAVDIPGAGGAGAADRALRAFVEKELADHGCTLVLLGDDLSQRLGTLKHAGEQLVIPDLAVLGRDSSEKRRVWTALGRYRLALRAAAAGRSTRAGPGAAAQRDGPADEAPDPRDLRS